MSKKTKTPKYSDVQMIQFTALMDSGERDGSKLCTVLGVTPQALHCMRMKWLHGRDKFTNVAQSHKAEASLSKGQRLSVSNSYMKDFMTTSGIDPATSTVRLIPNAAKKALIIQFS